VAVEDAGVFKDMTEMAPGFPFYFLQVLAGPHDNFHYVVGDPASREAAVVDPAFGLERLFSIAARDGYRIRTALFTHAHWDHIGGVPEIFDWGVRTVCIHETARDHAKVEEAKAAGAEVRLLRDGDMMPIGAVPVIALHTPGHQPESTCYLAGDPGGAQALFGGDTLFIDSCGRTDFPGGDTETMYASMARLRALEGDIIVLPGHHYAAHPSRSLAAQRTKNPALATTDRADFDALPFLRG
jgi:hydroxyacylglutathione hydrolase